MSGALCAAVAKLAAVPHPFRKASTLCESLSLPLTPSFASHFCGNVTYNYDPKCLSFVCGDMFPLHEATRLLDQNVRRQLRNRLLAKLAKSNGFAAADDLFFKDLFFVKYSTRTPEGERKEREVKMTNQSIQIPLQ